VPTWVQGELSNAWIVDDPSERDSAVGKSKYQHIH